MNSLINFDVIPIRNINDSKEFLVYLSLPMDFGWIEDVKFIVEMENNINVFSLLHLKNENNKAYFEVKLLLKNNSSYKFYFSYKVNNNIRYIINEENKEKRFNLDVYYNCDKNNNTNIKMTSYEMDIYIKSRGNYLNREELNLICNPNINKKISRISYNKEYNYYEIWTYDNYYFRFGCKPYEEENKNLVKK